MPSGWQQEELQGLEQQPCMVSFTACIHLVHTQSSLQNINIPGSDVRGLMCVCTCCCCMQNESYGYGLTHEVSVVLSLTLLATVAMAGLLDMVTHPGVRGSLNKRQQVLLTRLEQVCYNALSAVNAFAIYVPMWLPEPCPCCPLFDSVPCLPLIYIC